MRKLLLLMWCGVDVGLLALVHACPPSSDYLMPMGVPLHLGPQLEPHTIQTTTQPIHHERVVLLVTLLSPCFPLLITATHPSLHHTHNQTTPLTP